MNTWTLEIWRRAFRGVARVEKGYQDVESKKFEDLTKALAEGQSRRQVVKILAGGAVASVAGLLKGGGIRPGPAVAGGTTTTTTTKAPPTTTTTTTTKAPPTTTTTTTTKAPPTTTTTTTTKVPHTTPPPFCGHSTGPNGGCKGACTAAGFTGNQCNVICGNGQFTGACPVGQGGGNPCCNPGYCVPTNFTRVSGVATYVGPTSGCS